MPVGAQVGEVRAGVGEQVPDEGEEGVADGGQGAFLAAALGGPPVAGGEEGLGPGGAGRGLAEGAAEPGLPWPVVAALLRPEDWRARGANLAQDTRWPGVGKRDMSAPVSASRS